jgi:hypothetical protein
MAHRAKVVALLTAFLSLIAIRSAADMPALPAPESKEKIAAPTDESIGIAVEPVADGEPDRSAALDVVPADGSTGSLPSLDFPPPLPFCDPVCRPNFFAVFEAVSLARKIDEDQVFATLGTSTNDVLNANDFHFHQEAGMRVSVGARLSRGYVTEITAMGLADWDDTRAVSDASINAGGTAGNLFSPFTGFGSPPRIGLDFNDTVSIRLISSLDTLEWNLRQNLGASKSGSFAASAIYGFRYLRVGERLEYRSHSTLPLPAGSVNAVDVAMDNHLYGLQLGTSLDFRRRSWWVNLEGKAALCHNGMAEEVAASMVSMADPLNAPIDRVREEGSAAFVGQLSAIVELQLTENWIGRVGYQAIFVDGLALASRSEPAELLHGASALYHGPIAGLFVSW